MNKKILCFLIIVLTFLPTVGCRKEQAQMKLYHRSEPESFVILSEEDAEYILSLQDTMQWRDDITKTSCLYAFEYDDQVFHVYPNHVSTVIHDITNNKSLVLKEGEGERINEIVKTTFYRGSWQLIGFLYAGLSFDEAVELFGDPIWQDEAKTVARFDLTDGRTTVITFTPEAETGILLVKSWKYLKTSELD